LTSVSNQSELVDNTTRCVARVRRKLSVTSSKLIHCNVNMSAHVMSRPRHDPIDDCSSRQLIVMLITGFSAEETVTCFATHKLIIAYRQTVIVVTGNNCFQNNIVI